MAIKIRRGLDADRLSVIFEEGEILYTTDTKSFFIGDGVTAGGNQIGGTTAAELLKTEVHNATGATLTAGQVVYLSGNTGNKPNAVLAQADSEATSSKTIGLVITDIANNANGYIATDGLLGDLNTSMFAPGDMLWLSDSIAGGVTTIVPDTPNHAVFIGYVVSAHPTQGKILIHIQNGYELNELHDVKITSVANGDVLSYDSTLGYWKNVASSSFTPPNGLLKIASAISTTFQAVTDYLGNVSVLFLNNRRIGIGKDTSVTTQSVAVVEVQDANTSIVLKPNGTGAIIASVPDGTATGGNARGQYAVDLQMSRSNAQRVTVGNYSVITGGTENQTQGRYAFVGGGSLNNISGTGTDVYSVICGGLSNTNSSTYGVISGGQSNTASTNTHATVVGGQSNTSSGQYAIAGGKSSTATGTSTVALGELVNVSGAYGIGIGYSITVNNSYGVALGKAATASGNGSVAISAGAGNVTTASGISSVSIGNDTLASGRNSLCTGYFSNAYLFGQKAHSGQYIGGASPGNCQYSEINPFKLDTLTTAATTILSLDGTGTTSLIIPNGNNRLWKVKVEWNAIITTITGTATGLSVGNSANGESNFYFKKVGGTSTIGSFINDSQSTDNAIMDTCSMLYTAGASQELALTFTAPTFAGGGSVTIRTVAKISLTEVAY